MVQAFLFNPREEFARAPIPIVRVNGNSTRIMQATLDGALYLLDRRVKASELLFRLTAATLPVNLHFQLFQAPDGASGIGGELPKRIATIGSFVVPGAGASNYRVLFDEGAVEIMPGYLLVLYGRSGAGSATLRTYTVNLLDLFNQNVDGETPAASFTTTLPSGVLVPTFDPRPSPPGQATPTGLDVPGIVQLVSS